VKSRSRTWRRQRLSGRIATRPRSRRVRGTGRACGSDIGPNPTVPARPASDRQPSVMTSTWKQTWDRKRHQSSFQWCSGLCSLVTASRGLVRYQSQVSTPPAEYWESNGTCYDERKPPSSDVGSIALYPDCRGGPDSGRETFPGPGRHSMTWLEATRNLRGVTHCKALISTRGIQR